MFYFRYFLFELIKGKLNQFCITHTVKKLRDLQETEQNKQKPEYYILTYKLEYEPSSKTSRSYNSHKAT